jgi:outer membrane protease
MSILFIFLLIIVLSIPLAAIWTPTPYESKYFLIVPDVTKTIEPKPVFYVKGKWPRLDVTYGEYNTLAEAQKWCKKADVAYVNEGLKNVNPKIDG